jgi:cytochrome c5
MKMTRKSWLVGSCLLGAFTAAAVAGCYHTPVESSELAMGPAPFRIPSPERVAEAEACHSYEDSLTGAKVFAMYCSYCHNAPNLGERNMANFKNVAAHMRVRANLTGKEYARLMEFLNRWQAVTPPNPKMDASPKNLIYSQPMNELKPASDGQAEAKDGKNP